MLRNLSGRERVFSLLAGGLALNKALRNSDSVLLKTGLAGLGMGLLFRGSTGHCPLYQKMDYSSLTHFDKNDPKPENSILVNKPIEEVSRFLRESTLDFGSFFPGNQADEFSARIGADLWTLRLSPYIDGRRTLVKRTVESDPVKLKLTDGKAWAKAALTKFPVDASFDLRKLRSLIETGEIPTIQGQPHGRRSNLGRVIEKVKEVTVHEVEKNLEKPRSYAGLKGASL